MNTPKETIQSGQTDEVRFFLSQAAKRKVYSSTILAVLLVLTLGQPKLAFLLVVFAIPFGAWLSYSAYVLVRRPYARVAQAICILVWLTAIALILVIHWIGHDNARRDADDIVKTILAYQTDNRRCPQTLEGLLRRQPHLLRRFVAEFHYTCESGQPHLSYAATFTILDRHEYDFDKRAWAYRSWATQKGFISPQ